MNQKELISEIGKIAEEILDKKYQKENKDIIVENYIKFLNNEREFSKKEKLLKVLKNVKWYSNHNTDIYFFNIITEILNETIGDIFFICKNKRSSSCYSIVINLLREGKLEEDNIIDYDSENNNIEHKQLEKDAIILIMDDYCGSGDSIIGIIKAIEKNYSNKKVLILVYVWQIKAIKRIKEYLSNELNNNYEIIEKGIILESSYKEKFDTDMDSITYIQSICSNCQQKKLKYGYRKAGAMVTFDGVSPNSNISMLWHDNINYNNRKWIPVFNREYSLEALRRKKNEYLRKNKNEVLNFYNNSFLKAKITYDEFIVLIILFNTYSIRINYIKESLGYDSIEEITQIIEKFINYGIITYSIENILQFVDKEVINEMRKIDEEISRSVGIIKGTRKQIDK